MRTWVVKVVFDVADDVYVDIEQKFADIQNARPEGDKAKNWLPAPKEDFEVFMRAYWADAPILENKWSPPPVIRSP